MSAATLTPDDIEVMRAMRDGGQSWFRIAERFGVGADTVKSYLVPGFRAAKAVRRAQLGRLTGRRLPAAAVHWPDYGICGVTVCEVAAPTDNRPDRRIAVSLPRLSILERRVEP